MNKYYKVALTPAEEVTYMKEIYDNEQYTSISNSIQNSFSILQSRSQILLSIVSICISIAGFSGPKIAVSNSFSKYSIIIGVIFILSCALFQLKDLTQLMWSTRYLNGSMEETLTMLIKRRNDRTRSYYIAVILLIIGLFFNVLSIIGYLIYG